MLLLALSLAAPTSTIPVNTRPQPDVPELRKLGQDLGPHNVKQFLDTYFGTEVSTLTGYPYVDLVVYYHQGPDGSLDPKPTVLLTRDLEPVQRLYDETQVHVLVFSELPMVDSPPADGDENSCPGGKIHLDLEGVHPAGDIGAIPSSLLSGVSLPKADPFRESNADFKEGAHCLRALHDATDANADTLFYNHQIVPLKVGSRNQVVLQPDVAEVKGGQSSVVPFDNMHGRPFSVAAALLVPASVQLESPNVDLEPQSAMVAALVHAYPFRLAPSRREWGLAHHWVMALTNFGVVAGVRVHKDVLVKPLQHGYAGFRFALPTHRPWNHFGFTVARQWSADDTYSAKSDWVVGLDYAF